jgi:hypothetical protein
MAGNGRKSDGTFDKGNAGGPGRPPRVVERDYLVTMSDAVTLEDWRAIVARAVKDARDGDATARSWLSRHLLPPPPTSGHCTDPLRVARRDPTVLDRVLDELA